MVNVPNNIIALACLCLAVFSLTASLNASAATPSKPWIQATDLVRVANPATGKTLTISDVHLDSVSRDVVNSNPNSLRGNLSVKPSLNGRPLPPVPLSVVATPDAVKAGVKNLLRGGLAGLAVTEGLGALFDAADWILDPTNHTLKRLDEEFQGVWSVRLGSGDYRGSSPEACVAATRIRYQMENAELYDDVFVTSSGFYAQGFRWIGSYGRYSYGVCQSNIIAATGDPYVLPVEVPVTPDELDSGVDSFFSLEIDDISQLIAERTGGAFVKPNHIFIGEDGQGNPSFSQFNLGEESNTTILIIPNPNSSPTSSMQHNINFDSKTLNVTIPPNPDNLTTIGLDIVKTQSQTLDFNGTNQPAQSVTYNPLNGRYETPSLTAADSPVFNYTINQTTTYIVNGDTVYNHTDIENITSAPNDSIIPSDFQLPPFCSWAKPVCDLVNWFMTPPPDGDPDFSFLIPQEIETVDIDENILESNKSCPAPKIIDLTFISGAQLTLKYDLVCEAVSMIAPFFLIICYISGARIVLRA